MTDLDYRRKKLYFRSVHRGTKEMDIILTKYAEDHLGAMDEAHLNLYEEFLTENDQDLYKWFLGKENPPEKYLPFFD